MRYKPTNNGWKNIHTGLEWSRTLGRSAWRHAPTLIPAGWRLPTIEELVSIIDWSRFNPATKLPDTQSNFYWSATTSADNPDGAWGVTFHDGFVFYNDKAFSYYVRAVRGGL